jgi:hypothetical protein
MVVLDNELLDNEECDEHFIGFVIYGENCTGYLVYLLNYPSCPGACVQRATPCSLYLRCHGVILMHRNNLTCVFTL